MPNVPWCHDCNKPESLCECIVDGQGEVPEWALKVADALSKRVQIDVAAGMTWDIRQSIALALSKARDDAFRDCAGIAYSTPHYVMGVGAEAEDVLGRLKPGSPYDSGRYDASNEILAAIRQHSQKGER